MNSAPRFLSRYDVDKIHDVAIQREGGVFGVLNEHLLESAIHQPQQVYHYGGGDLLEAAAAYAFHIICNHPYCDGNKRTGMGAALAFLEKNGIDTNMLPDGLLYDRLIRMADHGETRQSFASFLRAYIRRR